MTETYLLAEIDQDSGTPAVVILAGLAACASLVTGFVLMLT